MYPKCMLNIKVIKIVDFDFLLLLSPHLCKMNALFKDFVLFGTALKMCIPQYKLLCFRIFVVKVMFYGKAMQRDKICTYKYVGERQLGNKLVIGYYVLYVWATDGPHIHWSF